VLKSLAYVKVMVGSNSQWLLEMERKVDVILEEFQNLENELKQEENAK